MIRGAITQLARQSTKLTHGTSIKITRAKRFTSGMDEGQPDWSQTPDALGTLNGDVQPAGKDAQEAFGLVAMANRQVIYLDPPTFTISPITCRAVVGSIQYGVLAVEQWPSHTRLLVEAV